MASSICCSRRSSERGMLEQSSDKHGGGKEGIDVDDEWMLLVLRGCRGLEGDC